MPRIRTMLELSTQHLPEHLRGTLGSAAHVVAYGMAYGWLLWVPDDPDTSSEATDEPIPAQVLTIQRYARRLGCDYVLFDQDADLDDQLPSWDW